MRRILVGLALALTALPAWAQYRVPSQEEMDRCYSLEDLAPTAIISNCNKMIQSGHLAPTILQGAYLSLCAAKEKLKQYDGAIADCTKAIQLVPDDPSNPSAYNNSSEYDRRGLSYLGKGLFDQAIADFSQAITLDGDSPAYSGWYHHDRALAYHRKGR